MAERKLSLVILGKATGALAAMKSVGDEAGGLGKKITDLLPSFKTVALAGAAAFGAVTAAAFGAAKAAAEDELSQKKLADQLRRTVNATDEQIAAVEQSISKQMMLTGVTDDQLRPAMAALVRATGDVSFAQQQLTLALDISTATGKDLESVSLALGKAFTGNIGALTKLGVPLDASVVKSKNLSEVVATLNTQFGGAAADAADTFSGRLRILQVSLSEAVEGIGYALLPFLERVVAFIQAQVVPVIQAFSDTLAGGGGLRQAFVNAGAQAGTFGLQVIDALEAVAKGVVAFGNIIQGVGKPLLVLIGNLGAALTFIATGFNFGAADKVFKSVEQAYLALDKVKVNTNDVAKAFDGFRASVAQQTKLNAALATGDRLSRQYGTTTKSTNDLNKQFAATLAGLQAKAGGAGGAVKKAADAAKTYGDAVVKARDATRAQTDAAKQVQKAQADVAAKTKAAADAQARFDTVVRGYPSNAKESIEANRRLADSQRGVRDAGLQVADAVRGVQEAEKRLADLRSQKADAEKVGGAERALERSKYGVEEANFRVLDAERALAELRLNPESSAIEIRRAEIDLADAKLGVFDAVQAVTDAERRLNEERAAGATPDEIAEAERNLERAKYAVTDAIDAQTQATDEQSAAQQHLNEITYGAVVGSAIYNAALKELEDAKAAQVDASDSLADALRREADAMRDLIEAQKALLAVQSATKAGVVSSVNAGLGVTVGAAGSITESVAAVAGAAPVPILVNPVTLNVTAPAFTNPAEVGTEVVDALAAYLRSNGTIPIPVGAFLGVI